MFILAMSHRRSRHHLDCGTKITKAKHVGKAFVASRAERHYRRGGDASANFNPPSRRAAQFQWVRRRSRSDN